MLAFNSMTEPEARKEVLDIVAEYCKTYHNKKNYQTGDRIPYASRVYDKEEMCNLVNAALEFWLTAGKYTDEFEQSFAEYLGVQYCSLVILHCPGRLDNRLLTLLLLTILLQWQSYILHAC